MGYDAYGVEVLFLRNPKLNASSRVLRHIAIWSRTWHELGYARLCCLEFATALYCEAFARAMMRSKLYYEHSSSPGSFSLLTTSRMYCPSPRSRRLFGLSAHTIHDSLKRVHNRQVVAIFAAVAVEDDCHVEGDLARASMLCGPKPRYHFDGIEMFLEQAAVDSLHHTVPYDSSVH